MRKEKAGPRGTGRRFILASAAVLLGIAIMLMIKSHWLGELQTAALYETTDALENPDRGFYLISGFVLSDSMDAASLAAEKFDGEQGHTLALIELNLRNYSEGDLSDACLQNLSELFDALRGTGLRFIVRFLYDWDGTNMEKEPTKRSIIERHMAQVAPIVNANADLIYTLQGLFVGNWGEMNGTRYTGAENWQALASVLSGVMDESLFLSVRMPMQWRRIYPESETGGLSGYRMGLFNDGILGSESDLGTYGDKSRTEAAYADIWCRADEMEFQELLCRTVPNGGEVVQSADGYTLDEAIEYLGALHVSYLNEDYDRRVLRGWAEETIQGGVWDGVDGLSYIAEHLGYRYTAENASLTYRRLSNAVRVTVDVRNVGFAPAYFGLRPAVVLCADGAARYTFPLDGDLSSLWGGAHTDAVTLSANIPLGRVEPGDYEVRLVLDSDRGVLRLATSGWTDGGCVIGGIRAK